MNRREKRLLPILPAALTLCIYSFVIAMPAQKELQSNLRELESVRSTAVTKLMAENAQANLEIAKQSFDRLKERLADEKNRISEISTQWRNSDTRLKYLQEITATLQDNNLSIVAQDHENEPELSTQMREVIDVINLHSPEDPLEFWQFEVEGAYGDIQTFLSHVTLEEMKTFPIAIRMKASESQNGLHTWTIIFVV